MGGIEFVAAVCPRCGADLSVPENLAKAHCVYCGAEVLIAGVQTPHPAQKVKCRACNGLGRLDLCVTCGGKGVCRWAKAVQYTAFGQPRHVQAHCSGGSCSLCRGSGRVEVGLISRVHCPACEGTGKCPQCNGTGKCHACQGLSMFPNPTGSVKCSVCGGVGFVDIDKADGARLDKCPSCGKPWPSGAEFCSYCGHTKNCPRCGVLWASNAVFCSHCGYRKVSTR